LEKPEEGQEGIRVRRKEYEEEVEQEQEEEQEDEQKV
jgi:hypothetical protein